MTTKEFLFNNDNNDVYKIKLAENVVLCAERINETGSMVYFMDENETKIDIPGSIQIYEFDGKNSKYKILLNMPLIKKFIILYSYDNYEIHYNGIACLQIISKSSWKISAIYKEKEL